MKGLIVLAMAATALCGAALGQTESVTDPPMPQIEGPWGNVAASFDSRPNGRDFATHYPKAALNRWMGGVVVLCCKAKPDRTLGCRVGAEWPTPDWKFGEASLKIADKFRLSPGGHDTVMAHPDAELRLPIRWNIEGGSDDRRYERSLQKASDVISGALLCRGERRAAPAG
jgi:hypothetical protein